MNIDRGVHAKEFIVILSMKKDAFSDRVNSGEIPQPTRINKKYVFWYESVVKKKLKSLKITGVASNMFKQKYIITVESESPPQICLGDKIHGATVISLEVEQYPDLVDLAWLTKRFPLSREMLSKKLELFNVGGSGKKLYDPNIVIPFLKTDLRNRIGRPRKN